MYNNYNYSPYENIQPAPPNEAILLQVGLDADTLRNRGIVPGQVELEAGVPLPINIAEAIPLLQTEHTDMIGVLEVGEAAIEIHRVRREGAQGWYYPELVMYQAHGIQKGYGPAVVGPSQPNKVFGRNNNLEDNSLLGFNENGRVSRRHFCVTYHANKNVYTFTDMNATNPSHLITGTRDPNYFSDKTSLELSSADKANMPKW